MSFAWPDNAAAAVSLSYDDGEPDNLDHAVPDLENAGFRGTFYLYKNGPAAERIGEWRGVYERGHEIGSHSMRHACRQDTKPGGRRLKNPLEKYTPADIADDIDGAAAWLDAVIGPDRDRTYAYPCGDTAIGVPAQEQPYFDAVRRHHTFARTTESEINDPLTHEPLRLGAFMFERNELAEFTDACCRAVEMGGWTILVFHSIGGANHGTDREIHQALLSELQGWPVWVAPVREVARHLRT